MRIPRRLKKATKRRIRSWWGKLPERPCLKDIHLSDARREGVPPWGPVGYLVNIRIRGEPGEQVSEPFVQEQLISLMLSRDMRPVAGMDFGFSHNFSVILGFTDGNRIYMDGCFLGP